MINIEQLESIIQEIVQELKKGRFANSSIVFAPETSSHPNIEGISIPLGDPGLIQEICQQIQTALIQIINKSLSLTEPPQCDLLLAGDSYYFNVSVQGVKNDKPTATLFSLQIVCKENSYTICKPSFKEEENGLEPIQDNFQKAVKDLGDVEAFISSLSQIDAVNNLPDLAHFAVLPIPPEHESHEEPKVAAPQLPVVTDHNEAFSKLATLEEKYEYLNNKLNLQEQYDLACANFHCAVLVLTAEKKEFEKFLPKQRAALKKNFIKNLLPELRQRLIVNGGQLDSSSQFGLEAYAKSIKAHLLKNPSDIRNINVDMLFVLTWQDPQFFSIYKSLSYLKNDGELDVYDIEKVGDLYNQLLSKKNPADNETSTKIICFADDLSTAVNQNLFPLGIAISMPVVQQTPTKESAKTKLPSQLVANAVERKKGINELIHLIDNKPETLQTILNASHDDKLLSTYLLSKPKLVSRLSPEGVKNLLQYDQGHKLEEPSFWRSVGMRLGLVANPLRSLDCVQLLELAAQAKKSNKERVNSIIGRCTQRAGWQSRVKRWIHGQPDYYEQLLVTPKALATFFKIADKEQIDGFIANNPQHLAALLNDIVREQSCDSSYITSLEEGRFEQLQKIVANLKQRPELIGHIKSHQQDYNHVQVIDNKDTKSSDVILGDDNRLQIAIQRRLDKQLVENSFIERIPMAVEMVKAIKENQYGAPVINLLEDLKHILLTLHGAQHAVDAFKILLSVDSKKANDFISNLSSLFEDLKKENAEDEKIISVTTELLAYLISKEEYREPIIKFLLNDLHQHFVKSSDSDSWKSYRQVRRLHLILKHDHEKLIRNELLNTYLEQCRQYKDISDLENHVNLPLGVFNFLLGQEKTLDKKTLGENSVRKVLDTHQAMLENLVKTALNDWLIDLHGSFTKNPQESKNTAIPNFLAIYLKLFDTDKARELFEQFFVEKTNICLELFDVGAKGELNWLYNKKFFWLKLFDDQNRFDNLLDDVEKFKCCSSCFVGVMADLLSDPNIALNHNFVTMIQPVLNLSNDETRCSLLNKIQEKLAPVGNVEVFLSKLCVNQALLDKLSTLKDDKLIEIIQASPSFWNNFFKNKLLVGKYINKQVKVGDTDDNYTYIENAINAVMRLNTKLPENKQYASVHSLISENCEKLGLEKTAQGLYVLTKYKGRSSKLSVGANSSGTAVTQFPTRITTRQDGSRLNDLEEQEPKHISALRL